MLSYRAQLHCTCLLQLLLALTLLVGESSILTGGLSAQETKPKLPTDDPESKRLVELDYETRPLVLLPGQFSEEAKNNRYKLGHWAVANLRVTATKTDANGQLHAYLVDNAGVPALVPGTRFHAESTRPATLPKGQQKNLEALVFLPKRPPGASTANVHVDIKNGTGTPLVDNIEPVLLLKPYQHHLLALVRNNEEYRFLRLLDCIQIPRLGAENAPPFFLVVYPSPEQPIPLASSALAWTTIAYILWDQILPEELSPEQQQALIDWLHFGGQLIISGPNSLDKLRGSLLEPYLPVTDSDSRNLVSGDFAQLNAYWSTPQINRPEERNELVVPATAPMLGIALKLSSRGRFLPGCDGMVAESAVGRGRIVVTGFPLSDKRLQTWPCFANFFNGAILRRPPRRFDRNNFLELTFRWANDGTQIFDPLLGSTLRFTSRDLPTAGTVNFRPAMPVEDDNDLGVTRNSGRQRMAEAVEADNNVERNFLLDNGPRNLVRDPWHYGGYEADPQAGVGAWNDEVGLAAAARESISFAAGITPPTPQFVLQMLGVYLLCLVPLNWLFFRLIGRVEWAWIAAPLIAILGAITVVRLASLDIGFVRSQSQIGLLEIPVDYNRGHLTEYTALYTSLSTPYEVAFEDASGLALPFPSKSPSGTENKQTPRAVLVERARGNQLRDFLVQSNSTGMLHSENLLDLGGKLELTPSGDPTAPKWELRNATQIDLNGAGVLYRTSDGVYQQAWLGDFPATSSRTLAFTEVRQAQLYRPWKEAAEFQSLDQRCREIWASVFGDAGSGLVDRLLEATELKPRTNQLLQGLQRQLPLQRVTPQSEITFLQFKLSYIQLIRADDEARLGLGEMFDSLTANLTLAPGEMRLIARSSDSIGQHRLLPEATRMTRSTLVLAHLQPVPFPQALSDENALIDFLGNSDLDWLRELEAPDDEPDQEELP